MSRGIKKAALFAAAAAMLSAFVLSVFTLNANAASASTSLDVSKVRVLLSIGSVTEKNFTLDGNYYLKEDKSIKLKRDRYTVKIDGSTLTLTDSAGNVAAKDKTSLTFVQCEATEGRNNYAVMSGNQRSSDDGFNFYKGDLKFGISSGQLTCVNTVGMEDYVQGVVGQEMSNSWELEALKAQAVVSRSYVTSYFNSSQSYDVTDTTRHQVYRGYRPLDTKVEEAVESTSGQFVTCDSHIVQTFFAASNGGIIEPTQHAWSGSEKFEPWQYAMYDEYDLKNSKSPTAEIKLYKNGEGLSSNVEKYLKDLAVEELENNSDYAVSSRSDVEIVKISSVKASGLASSLHTKDMSNTTKCSAHSSDAFTTPENAFSSCPNYSSYDVTMTLNVASGTKAVSEKSAAAEVIDATTEVEDKSEEMQEEIDPDEGTPERVTAADMEESAVTKEKQIQSSEEANLEDRAVSQAKISVTIDATQFRSNGSYAVLTQSTSYGRLITVEESSDYYSLMYRRFGHGVGMSQYGARQQASEGRTYDQIVSFYFPNTELTKLGSGEQQLEQLTGNSAMTSENPPVTAKGTVSGDSTLNVRSGPSTSYAKLGKLNLGDALDITVCNYADGWHQIYYNGELAYVSADYVTINSYINNPDDNGSDIENEIAQYGTLTVKPESMNLEVGDTELLIANIEGCSWQSSDESIVKVSDDGNITAKSAGTAEITAESPAGQTAKSVITVAQPEDEPELTLSLYTAIMPTNSKGKLRANIENVKWSSTNTEVATISETGAVAALKEGETELSATSPAGQTAVCKLTVSDKQFEIATKGELKLNESESTLAEKDTLALEASISGVSWKSSNTSVAKVSSSGLVTAVKQGTANITAVSAGGQTAVCKITVKTALQIEKETYGSIKLSRSEAIMPTNTRGSIRANIPGVKWKSSNTAVIRVSSGGSVLAVKEGTATITGTSPAGQKATCKVTVSDKKFEIATKGELVLGVTGANMRAGATGAISVNISGCTWKSSNTSVLTVTNAGKLKAVKAGSATITVTSPAGQKATCSIKVLSKTSYDKSLQITATKVNMTVGQSVKIKANRSGVTWTSSNKKVLTIDSDGNIKSVGTGTATVTCKTKAGSTAKCTITVRSK